MINAIRLAENDDSEVCDSDYQIGHVLFSNGVNREFTVRALKCRSDDKQHKNSWKR